MAIRSDEITSIIRGELKGFEAGADVAGVGTIVEVGDGIAQIYGLSGALASELLEFPNGIMGMAFNLEEETVGALILGDYTSLKEGDQVKTTGRVVEVPVGDALIGRVVNPLGEPIDGKGPIESKPTRPVDRIAPCVTVPQPPGSAVSLRGIEIARLGLLPGIADEEAFSRSRGVLKRHLTRAPTAAGACGAAPQGQRRRIAHRVAGDRDPGGGSLRLQPHQR